MRVLRLRDSGGNAGAAVQCRGAAAHNADSVPGPSPGIERKRRARRRPARAVRALASGVCSPFLHSFRHAPCPAHPHPACCCRVARRPPACSPRWSATRARWRCPMPSVSTTTRRRRWRWCPGSSRRAAPGPDGWDGDGRAGAVRALAAPDAGGAAAAARASWARAGACLVGGVSSGRPGAADWRARHGADGRHRTPGRGCVARAFLDACLSVFEGSDAGPFARVENALAPLWRDARPAAPAPSSVSGCADWRAGAVLSGAGQGLRQVSGASRPGPARVIAICNGIRGSRMRWRACPRIAGTAESTGRAGRRRGLRRPVAPGPRSAPRDGAVARAPGGAHRAGRSVLVLPPAGRARQAA